MIPGSAMRKLEAQTGMKVSRIANGTYCLEIFENVGYFSESRDEKTACEELRGRNWERVCREVAYAQGHRCFSCQQIKPLQGHHVITRARWRRSNGPLDSERNIKMLCSACHEDQHR